MAYVTPKTWVTGDTVSASQLNQDLRDNVEYVKGLTDGLSFSGTRLQRSATQSIPDSTNTLITWQTEVFDYGGWWSSGTNVVVPSGAIPSGFTSIAVQCYARAEFAASAVGTRRLRILIDGASAGGSNTTGISGDTTDLDTTVITTVTAGQVITLEAYQSSGGALTVGANVTIAVTRIAPAA